MQLMRNTHSGLPKISHPPGDTSSEVLRFLPLLCCEERASWPAAAKEQVALPEADCGSQLSLRAGGYCGGWQERLTPTGHHLGVAEVTASRVD